MSKHRNPSRAPALERPAIGPIVPAGAFLRPAVLMEFLVGLSPLAGVALWGWDAVPVVMLHLLALAVAAGFLVVRTATLPDTDLAYFISHKNDANDADGQAPRWHRTMRLWLPGFLLLVLGFPLLLLTAMTVETFGAAEPVRSAAEFWRVVVWSSGLWMPLAAVCVWEAGSFFADVVLPRLKLGIRFGAPSRLSGSAYGELSTEMHAYLYARAWVVLRMVVTALGVGTGLIFSQNFGVIGLIVLLFVLNASVAVVLEAFAIADAERRPGRGGVVRNPEAV